MKIDIETLKKTNGIGSKTLERIMEQHYEDEGIKQFKSEYIPSETYRADEDINLWNGDCIVLFGSESTGVAAKNLNRKFIGIELDKDYFEITRKRITNQGCSIC